MMNKSIRWVYIRIFLPLLVMALGACSNEGGSEDDLPPPPPRQFEFATPASGISFTYGYLNSTGSEPEKFAGGVAAGDFDNDGYIDLLIVRGNLGPNLLYRNLGNNTFAEIASQAGLAYTQSATENYRHSGPVFVDIDGDGDLDLFIGGLEGDPSLIFRNNLIGTGEMTFTDVTPDVIRNMTSKYTISAAFGDYDLDGDLDMMLAHWGTPRLRANPGDTESLWRNDSDETGIQFTGVSVESGIAATIIAGRGGSSFLSSPLDHDYTFTPTFARLNADFYPDILSVADYRNTRVFINNAETGTPITFTDATDTTVIIDRNGMGSAVGDFDNDGDLDWFVSGIWGAGEPVGNRLYRNNGDGVFSDITFSAGVHNGGWGWGACFADFNLDGHLDIFHTNGWNSLNTLDNFEVDASRLFISNGDGLTFTDRAVEYGLVDTQQGRGVVCADFDNDGDIDVFITHRDSANASSLWRNDLQSKNYLRVKLVGNAPNTEAAGARIKVTTGAVTKMREIMMGNNFVSQNPAIQVFGLGSAAQADSILIEWPNGVTDMFSNVAANQTLVYVQP